MVTLRNSDLCGPGTESGPTRTCVAKAPGWGEQELKALILAGLAGNEPAYAQFLHLAAGRLRSYFGRRLPGRGADVEDLVQESLIAIHLKRGTYDRERPFTPWLQAIARHRLIDFLRKESRRHVLASEGPVDVSSEEELEAGLAAVDVDHLLSLLPRRQAAAIRLARLEGLSVNDASLRSGRSKSSIKMDVHRGMSRLIALIRLNP